MRKYMEYFSRVEVLLKTILETQEEGLEKSAELIKEAVVNKNSIFSFGASHAGIITEELFYRAGGLALINPILEPSMMLNVRPVTFTSRMERLEGYGNEIADKAPIKRGDIVICHSVSGRNSVMIDFVGRVREKGARIIAITNVEYSKEVESRHSSGKRLYELADIVIDNCGEKGDACIEIEGMEQKVSPTSTIAGAAIVNSIVAEAADLIRREGVVPPYFHSANVDGGDEHNRKIFDEYRDNIFYM